MMPFLRLYSFFEKKIERVNAFFKRVFVSSKPELNSEDDKAWNKKQSEKLAEYRKRNIVFYILKKYEYQLILIGIICILFDKLLSLISPVLYILSRVFVGLAIGILWGNYHDAKFYRKVTFVLTRWQDKFIAELNKAIEENKLKEADHKGGKHVVN